MSDCDSWCDLVLFPRRLGLTRARAAAKNMSATAAFRLSTQVARDTFTCVDKNGAEGLAQVEAYEY